MSNHTSFTSSWIESFILKGKISDNFSFITKAFTVILCSLILVLSAKIKVDLVREMLEELFVPRLLRILYTQGR